MTLEFEVYEGYKLTLHNKDTCMGQYYPEDDWTIVLYGQNQTELIDQYLWEMERISVAHYDLDRVKYIIHEGRKIELEEVEYLNTYKNKAWQEFVTEILYGTRWQAQNQKNKEAKLREEERIKIQKTEENRLAAAQAVLDKIADEKKLLTELKAKYETL